MLGTLPLNPAESANALERLFNSASAMDSMDEADLSIPGMGMGGFDSFDVDSEGNATKSADPDAGPGAEGQGVHSFTLQLNVSASCGIGGAFRGCLGGVQGVSGVVRACVGCVLWQTRLRLS